jgi:hypothetical protein
MVLYLNGVVTHASFSFSPGAAPIASIYNTTNSFATFRGYYDCFMYWKRPLSAVEVNWLWQDPYVVIRPAGPTAVKFPPNPFFRFSFAEQLPMADSAISYGWDTIQEIGAMTLK